MRQAVITRAGGPQVLQVQERPDPSPAPGEVRIRVKFSGVNYADIMARLGLYPDAPPIPCVVGYEVSGIIDQVGPGATTFAEGDRVLSLCRFGGYADTVIAPIGHVYHMPDTLSFQTAAAIPVNYATAWIMLIRSGNLHPGETALIHAAAGGVGQAALQICQWRGATVIGTASPAKHPRLRELGVAHCIDYTREDFQKAVMAYTHGRGVDIVLDAVGGNSFRKSYRCLAPLGRLFCFGASSMTTGQRANPLAIAKLLLTMPFFHPMPLMDTNRGVFGTNMGHLWDVMDRLRPDMEQILALVQDGTFNPVVDRCFPLAQAGEAHAFLQDRKNFGKVLLEA